MQLVFLYGPPAVGKYTIDTELAGGHNGGRVLFSPAPFGEHLHLDVTQLAPCESAVRIMPFYDVSPAAPG